MIMISGPVLMNICVGDEELHASEKEFVYKVRDTMGNMEVVPMKTEMCPMGGHNNILRYEKSVDAIGERHSPC